MKPAIGRWEQDELCFEILWDSPRGAVFLGDLNPSLQAAWPKAGRWATCQLKLVGEPRNWMVTSGVISQDSELSKHKYIYIYTVTSKYYSSIQYILSDDIRKQQLSHAIAARTIIDRLEFLYLQPVRFTLWRNPTRLLQLAIVSGNIVQCTAR